MIINHLSKNSKKFVKFMIVGLSNTVITFFVYAITIKLIKLHYLLASTLGYVFGLINSYIWNLRWTFKSNHSNRILIKFILVNFVALSVNLISMRVMVEKIEMNEFIAQIIAIGISLIVNFGGNNFWTFK